MQGITIITIPDCDKNVIVGIPANLNIASNNAMKCTACHEGTLSPTYLEGLLPCHECSNCGGTLLVLSDYLKWRDIADPSVIEGDIVNDGTAEVHAEETEKAMLCPKTGGLMTKYRISKDTEHRLDLSPSANAVWMDKGEWELLKAQGLTGELNNVFTAHWQHEIRGQESAEILDALYQKKFGDKY